MRAILFVLLLTGCSSMFPQPQVIIKNIPVLPDDSFLMDCTATVPYTENLLKTMSMEQQIAALTELSDNLYGNLATCNAGKQSLRDWKAKKLQEYKEK